MFSRSVANTSGIGSIHNTSRPRRAYKARSWPTLAPTWITPCAERRNRFGSGPNQRRNRRRIFIDAQHTIEPPRD